MQKINLLIAAILIFASSIQNKLTAQESYLWTTGITIGNYYNIANYYGINYQNPWTYTREFPIPLIHEPSEWLTFTAAGANSQTGGIKTDGTMWIWSSNSSPEKAPEPSQYGTNNDWKAISFTNSGRYAIKENGTLWRIMGEAIQIGTDSNWETISSATERCVALKTDGSIWTWTNNSAGAFEDNVTQFGTESEWKYISAHLNNGVLGIKTDGTLWVWNIHTTQGPTQEGTDSNWKMAYGGPQLIVGLKENGTIWTRGNNNSTGQLGLGHTTSVSELTQVGSENDWVKIAMGGGHVFALKDDGSLYGWGNNNYRQLGDGSTTNRTSPVQIGEAGEWLDVAAGPNHGVLLRNYGYAGPGGNSGVSIGEIEPSNIFSIYPNPASYQAKVDLRNTSFQTGSTIEIINTQGKILLVTNVSSTQPIIDLSAFSSGLYFLKIHNNYACSTEKFIVE